MHIMIFAMRLLMIVLFVILAGDLPVLSRQTPSPEPIGHFSPETTEIDLGTIAPDRLAERVLNFRNTGSGPLQIVAVFTDCGCTAASYSEEPVEIGRTGEIRIVFNPKGRSPGPFRKTLRIRSTADNPRQIVVVKGEVMTD